MSYKLVKHTFGKSTDRRRFLLLNIVVHLVSSALQLVISVTQPLYLATRTDPEIFDFWICMRIRSREAQQWYGNMQGNMQGRAGKVEGQGKRKSSHQLLTTSWYTSIMGMAITSITPQVEAGFPAQNCKQLFIYMNNWDKGVTLAICPA